MIKKVDVLEISTFFMPNFITDNYKLSTGSLYVLEFM